MNHWLTPQNRLFELARGGRRLPHLVVTVVITFVLVIVAQLVGGIPAMLLIFLLSRGEAQPAEANTVAGLVKLLQPDTAPEQTIMLVLAFAPLFVLLWAWLKFFEKRPLWTIGMERAGAGIKYLRGLLAGLIMFGVVMAVSAALGVIAVEPGGSQPQGLAALGGVLLVFVGWTVQGPAEEALMRGWVLPVVGARYRPWLGVLVSALLFAGLHSLNPNLNPIAMLNLFLFGLLAAGYALVEGGLWGVFGLHAAWNWAQGNIFGLEVSGMVVPGGTLLNLQETGPDAITGGSFGPEGGLAVTGVLLLGLVVIWLWGWRQKPAG